MPENARHNFDKLAVLSACCLLMPPDWPADELAGSPKMAAGAGRERRKTTRVGNHASDILIYNNKRENDKSKCKKSHFARIFSGWGRGRAWRAKRKKEEIEPRINADGLGLPRLQGARCPLRARFAFRAMLTRKSANSGGRHSSWFSDPAISPARRQLSLMSRRRVAFAWPPIANNGSNYSAIVRASDSALLGDAAHPGRWLSRGSRR